jgi:Putative prokaryotic signal transducing protein
VGLLSRLLGRDGRARSPSVRWVRVATARNQPEANMLAGMLRQQDIPAMVRGIVAVPEMMDLAPHEVLVPGDRALEAHALIDPMEPVT